MITGGHKKLKCTIDKWYCFLCFSRARIHIWYPFSLITRSCCTDLMVTIPAEIWKTIFRTCWTLYFLWREMELESPVMHRYCSAWWSRIVLCHTKNPVMGKTWSYWIDSCWHTKRPFPLPMNIINTIFDYINQLVWDGMVYYMVHIVYSSINTL